MGNRRARIQTVAPDRRDDPRARFLSEFGRALGTYAVSAHRIEEAITNAAFAMGIDAQVFSTPTSVFISVEIKGKRETLLARVDPASTDLSKIVALDEILHKVADGRIGPSKATRLVKRVVARKPRYPLAPHIACFGIASACAARFFGGGFNEIITAATIGLVIGSLHEVARRQRHLARLIDFLGGFLGALIAFLATFVLTPVSVETAMIAGLIIMLPGMMITVAMSELATRNLVSGGARLVGAIAIFLSIGLGVAVADRIAGALDAPVSGVIQTLPTWTEAAAALVAPISFAVLFHARIRDWTAIFLAGIACFAAARFGTATFGPELGAGAAAAFAGILGNLYARYFNRPASTIVLPGILMLVPGSLGFRSFEHFLADDAVTGTQTAFRVLVTALALTAGLLLANVAATPKRSL